MTYFSALIVEDDESRAKLHTLGLQEQGLECLAVSSVNEALIALENAPAFSLVLSDLNFDPRADMSNTDGRKIGRWAMDHLYPGYTALCSAVFGDTDEKFLEAKREFDATFPHSGGTEAYARLAEAARSKAIDRIRDSKLAISPESALISPNRLRSIHELFGDPDTEENSFYFNRGFRIIVVQPTSSNFPIGNPFFVWVNAAVHPVVLEVYRHPTLFSTGSSVEEALRNLSEIISSTHIDLINSEVGGKMRIIRDFVSSIFSRQSD